MQTETLKTKTTLSASELRLGNWIKTPNGKPMCVKNILENSVNQKIDGDGVIGSYQLGNFEPIPLSPDILLSAGFDVEEKESRRNDIPDNKYQVYTKGAFTYNSIHGWWFNGKQLDNQPEYLHQLQNGFFFLTGTEITITL